MPRLSQFLTRTLFIAGGLLASGSAAFAGEGVNVKAEVLFNIGPMPVTNSMVTAWAVAAVLILVVRLAVRKPSLQPSRAQVVVETLVQGILNLIKPIVGSRVSMAVFPLLISLFVYILAENWSGLLPGVGSIYYKGEQLIRPGHADLNGTLSLALIAMAAWFYFIMKYAGPAFVIKDWFGNKADKSAVPAVVYYLMAPLFIAVGFIEIISIIFRPVSLSFRLFGNMFGGENLLHAMSGMAVWSKWVLPIPFYFLELLVGLVQALVFTLLVSVYIGLICNHGGGHEEKH